MFSASLCYIILLQYRRYEYELEIRDSYKTWAKLASYNLVVMTTVCLFLKGAAIIWKENIHLINLASVLAGAQIHIYSFTRQLKSSVLNSVQCIFKRIYLVHCKSLISIASSFSDYLLESNCIQWEDFTSLQLLLQHSVHLLIKEKQNFFISQINFHSSQTI